MGIDVGSDKTYLDTYQMLHGACGAAVSSL